MRMRQQQQGVFICFTLTERGGAGPAANTEHQLDEMMMVVTSNMMIRSRICERSEGGQDLPHTPMQSPVDLLLSAREGKDIAMII